MVVRPICKENSVQYRQMTSEYYLVWEAVWKAVSLFVCLIDARDDAAMTFCFRNIKGPCVIPLI